MLSTNSLISGITITTISPVNAKARENREAVEIYPGVFYARIYNKEPR